MAKQNNAFKDSYYYRAEKLKGNKLSIAARHNKRAILKELGTGGHIDPLRSHLNYSLAGCDTPRGIVSEALAMMQAAGIVKLRHDAVKAIEIVFSLPVGSSINHRDYFTECLSWTRQAYDGAHVLAADVHLDEAAPHCHVLLLPLVNGKMIGSDLMGGKPLLSARRGDFYERVASRYGLTKPPKSLSNGASTALYESIIEQVKAQDPSAVKGVLWAFTRDAIRDNPVKAAQLLGIKIADQTTGKKVKLFSDYYVSKGAGAKTEKVAYNPNRVQSQNIPDMPINTGIHDIHNPAKSSDLIPQRTAQLNHENKHQTLSCVGFTHLPQSHTTETQPDLQPSQQAKESTNWAAKKVLALTPQAWLESDIATAHPIVIDPIAHPLNDTIEFKESTTRIRDDEQRAEHYDCDTGEYCPPAAIQSVKPHYDRLASKALGELRKAA